MNKLVKEPSLKLGRPSYQQIQSWLLEKLVEEDWQVGSRIPGETTLAKQFGISAMPVRQALQKLTEDGYFVRHRGKGTFVSKLPPRIAKTYAPGHTPPPTPADPLKGKTIAVCVPHIEHFADPSSRILAIVSSVEALLENKGAKIRFLEFQDTAGHNAASLFDDEDLFSGVGGVIYFHSQRGSTRSEDRQIYELIASGLPTVVYDYHGHAPIDRVEVDEFSANKLLLEHLTELGYKNFVFCAHRSSFGEIPAWLEARINGFKEAANMLQLDITEKDILIPSEPESVDDGTGCIQLLTGHKKGVDAIIASHDRLALGIRQTFLEKNQICPPIVGFDNTYRAKISGLTSVATPAEAMSLSAVQLLRKQLQRETPCTYQRIFHLPELMIRESTQATPPQRGVDAQ